MKEKALDDLKKKQRRIYLTTFLKVSVLLAIVSSLYFVLKNLYVVWTVVATVGVVVAAIVILFNLNMISSINQAKKDIILDKYKVERDEDGKVKIVTDRLWFFVDYKG